MSKVRERGGRRTIGGLSEPLVTARRDPAGLLVVCPYCGHVHVHETAGLAMSGCSRRQRPYIVVLEAVSG